MTVKKQVLDNRVPTVLDVDNAVHRDFGLCVVVFKACLREAAKRVNLRQRNRGFLDFVQLCADKITDFRENALLECKQTLVRRENLALDFFQLLGDVTLAVGESLLADIILGNLVLEAVGNLDVIAENAVVSDLQRADTRSLALAFLNLAQYLFTARRNIAKVVNILVEAVPNNAAVANIRGKLVIQRVFDKGSCLCEVAYAVVQLAQQPRVQAVQLLFNRGEYAERFSHRLNVLR